MYNKRENEITGANKFTDYIKWYIEGLSFSSTNVYPSFSDFN